MPDRGGVGSGWWWFALFWLAVALVLGTGCGDLGPPPLGEVCREACAPSPVVRAGYTGPKGGAACDCAAEACSIDRLLVTRVPPAPRATPGKGAPNGG